MNLQCFNINKKICLLSNTWLISFKNFVNYYIIINELVCLIQDSEKKKSNETF